MKTAFAASTFLASTLALASPSTRCAAQSERPSPDPGAPEPAAQHRDGERADGGSDGNGPIPTDARTAGGVASIEAEVERLRALLPESLRRLPEPVPDAENAFAAWEIAFEKVVTLEEYGTRIEGDPEVVKVIASELASKQAEATGEDRGEASEDVPEAIEELVRGIVWEGRPYPRGRTAEILDGWLAANAPVVPHVREGLSRPFVQSVRPDELLDLYGGPRTPSIFRRLEIGEILGLAARRDLTRGDVTEAISHVLLLLRFGERLRKDSTLTILSDMISAGVIGQALALIEGIAVSPRLEAADLAALDSAVAALDDPRAGFRRAVANTAGVATLPFLAAFGGDLDPGAFADLVAGLGPEAGREGLRRRVFSYVRGHPCLVLREETVRLLGARAERLVHEATLPWHEILPEAIQEDIERELAAWPAELGLLALFLRYVVAHGSDASGPPAFAPGTLGASILGSPHLSRKERRSTRKALAGVRNPVGKALVSFELIAGVRALGNLRDLELERRFVILALALRRHEISAGPLPETMDGLVEHGCLRELPTDPFSGKPFGYSRERRLLWSVGLRGDTGPAPEDLTAEGSSRGWRSLLGPGASPRSAQNGHRGSGAGWAVNRRSKLRSELDALDWCTSTATTFLPLRSSVALGARLGARLCHTGSSSLPTARDAYVPYSISPSGMFDRPASSPLMYTTHPSSRSTSSVNPSIRPGSPTSKLRRK